MAKTASIQLLCNGVWLARFPQCSSRNIRNIRPKHPRPANLQSGIPLKMERKLLPPSRARKSRSQYVSYLNTGQGSDELLPLFNSHRQLFASVFPRLSWLELRPSRFRIARLRSGVNGCASILCLVQRGAQLLPGNPGSKGYTEFRDVNFLRV